NHNADFLLAQIYAHKDYNRMDLTRSTQLYQNLSDRGNKSAYFPLAQALERGIGTEVNVAKAAGYYVKVLHSGHSESFFPLAKLDISMVEHLGRQTENISYQDLQQEIRNDNKKIKILHFWHEGADVESYRKTALLALTYPKINPVEDVGFHMAFIEDDPESQHKPALLLAEAMGYRGVAY